MTEYRAEYTSLDEAKCDDISFLPFHPPPPSTSSEGWSQWVESLEAIDYDLRYLLRLSHLKFWCQSLHDKSLACLLDTYLQHAPRPHEEAWSLPMHVMELLRNIHRRVFMTFLRLSTHKEDQNCQFPLSVFGDLLHTHSLFTIPRILDLCSIYGNSNRELLNKMVENVFDKQPLYWKELESVMTTSIRMAFRNLVEKCSNISTISLSETIEFILYFNDIVHSLSSLLSVYPNTATVLWKTGLIECLIDNYETIIPPLQKQWKELKYRTDKAGYVTQCLRLSKQNTSKIVHTLLMIHCHDTERAESEDQLLTCFNLIVSAKMFFKEFEKHYCLKDCFRSLKEAYPNLDEGQLQYMLEGVIEEATHTSARPTNGSSRTKSKSKGREPNIKEMVTYIKDMLPHLEEDFIKKCLKEFNYNQEVVIHHILEGTLPPHLQENEELPVEAPPSPQPLEEGQSILEGRTGIYDFDEFDVFRRKDVDLSKIQIGKKHESLNDILSDRSHIKYTKGMGLDLLPFEYDEYEDEYDDTYDSHNIGSLDPDSSEDLFTVKRLNVKGQFSSRGHKWINEDDNEQEEMEQVKPVEPVQLLQRPVTPEKIRKEKDTQAADHLKQTAKGKKTNQGASGKKGKKAELKQEETKPTKSERKEQWASSEGATPHPSTDRQRANKERQKSSRANHNRRALSDKKRSGFS